jgi:hypothetical protein
MLKRVFLLGAAALLGQAACLGTYDKNVPSSVVDNDKVSDEQPAVRPVSPEDSTSLWMQYGDPAILAARAAEEGPLDISSRMHGCHKFKFHTLGQVMADLGVNMTAPTGAATATLVPLELALRNVADPTTVCNNIISTNQTQAMEQAAKVAQPARYLYCSARLTLGMPPYAARLAESTQLTTAGATKEFDTLAAAAIEIANTNLANATRCKDAGGAKAVLFDTVGSTVTCNVNGMACLQGYMPSPEQINLCNRLLVSGEQSNATTVSLPSGNVPVGMISAVDAGKRLAAAAVLANALLCE